MVELALVLPLVIVFIYGMLLIGLWVFYSQQVTNAAREASRFAAVHSATAQCPTASKLAPLPPPSDHYYACDSPGSAWPAMTAHAQARIFGLSPSSLIVAACWSSYTDDLTGSYDAPPPGNYAQADGTTRVVSSTWRQCTISDASGTARDPLTETSELTCDAKLPDRTQDTGSNLSEGPGRIVANQITAVACYRWHPPLGGLGIPIPCADGWCTVEILPSDISIFGVVTEPIQRQQ